MVVDLFTRRASSLAVLGDLGAVAEARAVRRHPLRAVRVHATRAVLVCQSGGEQCEQIKPSLGD